MPDQSDLSEDDVRRELAAILPRAGEPAPWDGLDEIAAGRLYLGLLRPGGWMVPTWPVEHGGRGLSAGQAATVERIRTEFASADLYPFTVGLAIVGPTLLRLGTEEQRARWCGPIASGEQIWCQMFSEPGAGSDIAGLATLATDDGDGWSVTGQKVWTSRAHYADLGFCLVRTDPTVPKHRGISMLALPMRQEGVTVVPLPQINGDLHFNEVFLDGARVPSGNLVGERDHGWDVALTALAFERTTTIMRQVSPDPLSVPHWLAQLHSEGTLEDPVLLDRAMRAFQQVATSAMADERSADMRAAGAPGAEGSAGKLRHAAAYRAVAEVVHDARGLAGLLADDPSQIEFLVAPSMSIRGGTDEIQRNIIAERVLGLPKDPFKDTDIPWNRRVGARPDAG
jgi:alkylation response protein AidB-like acyl-CoA dehydrogenase